MKSLFLFLLPLAFAGNRVGNGGNVLVCPGKIQLLDFYEAGKLSATKSKDHKDLLDERLSNLARAAPKLADQYRRRVKSIMDEIEFKKDVALSEVDDSFHAFKPSDPNCKIRQIAIRQDVPVGDKRFVFDKGLWDKLSEHDRAGLILHEIIYEHFAKLGATDSRKARRMNAYIFSTEIEKSNTGKVWKFIGELDLPIYP